MLCVCDFPLGGWHNIALSYSCAILADFFHVTSSVILKSKLQMAFHFIWDWSNVIEISAAAAHTVTYLYGIALCIKCTSFAFKAFVSHDLHFWCHHSLTGFIFISLVQHALNVQLEHSFQQRRKCAHEFVVLGLKVKILHAKRFLSMDFARDRAHAHTKRCNWMNWKKLDCFVCVKTNVMNQMTGQKTDSMFWSHEQHQNRTTHASCSRSFFLIFN